jgi:hypothetical protein
MKAKDLKLFLGLKPDAPHDQLVPSIHSLGSLVFQLIPISCLAPTNPVHRITTPNPLLTSLLILHPVKHKGLLYYTLHEGFKAGFRGSLTGG